MINLNTFRGISRLAVVSTVVVALSAPMAFAGSSTTLLTQDQIIKKVLDQGYTEVIRMEMEDGLYEVKAKNKDGERVNLNVDPKSGTVLGVHKDGLFSN